MARGNMVDMVIRINRFGVIIFETYFPYQSFKDYDKMYITKAGTIIGVWGTRLGYSYKDYIAVGYKDCKIQKIFKNRIYLI